MQEKVSIILSLLSLVAIGLLSGPSACQGDTGSGISSISDGAVQAGVQTLESRDYYDLSNRMINQYSEDMNFSAQIFSQYRSGNITRLEAVSGAAASYTLTTRTLDDMRHINPPEGYEAAHGYTIGLLTSLRDFEWNMAKYYETNRTYYASVAKDSLNTSADYCDMLAKELKMLDMTLY